MNFKKLVLVLGAIGALVGSTLAVGQQNNSAFLDIYGNKLSATPTAASASSASAASALGASNDTSSSYCNGMCTDDNPCISLSDSYYAAFTQMLKDANISYDFSTCNVYISALQATYIAFNIDTFNSKSYRASASALLTKSDYFAKFGGKAMKTSFDAAKKASDPSSSITLQIDLAKK